MTVDSKLLDRLKTRGEEVFTQVSAELMSNPRFMKAMEGALRGKERLEDVVGRAVKSMNIPTRSEYKKALARIEHLEREVTALKKAGARPKSAARSGAKTRGRRSRPPRSAG